MVWPEQEEEPQVSFVVCVYVVLGNWLCGLCRPPGGGGGGGVDALSSSGSVGSDDTATKSPGPAFGGVARLKGGGQDLYNPLAWDNMPLALQEKFPHWKDGSTPQSKSNSNSQSGMEQLVSVVELLCTSIELIVYA